MIKKGQRFLCIKDVVTLIGSVDYIYGDTYESEINGCITDLKGDKRHRWPLSEKYYEHFQLITEPEIKTPDYYDNPNGSLYSIAMQRNWNAYLFDVVKRLERGGKKDPLKVEIEKSIAVLQLWLKEQNPSPQHS